MSVPEYYGTFPDPASLFLPPPIVPRVAHYPRENTMTDQSITLPTKPLQQALRAAQRFTDTRFSGVRLRVRDGEITVASTNSVVLATIKVPAHSLPLSTDWDRVISHRGRQFALSAASDTITIKPLPDGCVSLATDTDRHLCQWTDSQFPRSADVVINRIPAAMATVIVPRSALASALRVAGERQSRIVTPGTGYDHATVIVEGEEVGRLDSKCRGQYAYCEIDSPTLLRAVRAMKGTTLTINLPDGEAPIAIGASNGTWILGQCGHRKR